MVRNVICVLAIGLLTPLLFPVAVLAMLLTFSADTGMWWCQIVWSRLMMGASGATIEVVAGKQHLDPKTPVIFLSNHMSTLDIPVLFRSLWPVRPRFAAKSSVKWVPFLGWWIWLAGFIFIDRGRTRAAIKSLDLAGEKIRKGTSIILFPEGTRSVTGQVLPFKKGPFMLALKAGVPILPVTIVGTDIVMPKNSWNITPAVVKVKIGDPIDPKPYADDRDALIQRVRDVIIDQSVELGGKGGDKRQLISKNRDNESPGQPTEASA